MKKIYQTIFLFGICTLLYSQPEKGKLFTGGNIGYYISSNDSNSFRSSTVNDLTILPLAGYFVSDKIAIGIRTGINFRKEETPGASPQKKSRLLVEISPFGRYYIWKYSSNNGLFSVAGAVGLFTDVSFSAKFGKEKNFVGKDVFSQKIKNFSVGLSPGIYYYLTDRVSFDAKIGWLGLKSETTDDGTTKNTSKYYGIDLSTESITLGMNYLF